MSKKQKYIFVTGGVVSGLGKGISGSSIATILKNSGYKVFMQKLDPYLNIDPGTMNPFEHGEVFVTSDGAETDLDLGHYERFIDENLTQMSNVTAGSIYQKILQQERHGDYNGSTVQVIPHVTNQIKLSIYNCNPEADIIITEIGGTVGDIESLPFIEAIRQIVFEKGHNVVMIFHVGLIPYIHASNEDKTKPIQHSVKQLQSFGLQPNCIVARSKHNLDKKTISKISRFCNVPVKNVIVAKDEDSIYKVPLNFAKQNINSVVAETLGLKMREANMKPWEEFVEKIKKSKNILNIAIVGKYISLPDAYLSVIESLNIAGYECDSKVKIHWIFSSNLTKKNIEETLKPYDGILIPGGFGERGIDGKILAVQYAREFKVPFLGLCLGMQVAVIEYARNICKFEKAHSTEFNKKTPYPIFDIIRGKSHEDNLGGTLRLGNYLCTLKRGSLAMKLYNAKQIYERHRHRFELNNNYVKLLEQKGLVFSGVWIEKKLIEIVELPNHPFFIGTQFHPEFTSRPNKPNPLFYGFLKKIYELKNKT